MERYSEYKDSGVEWLGEIPRHWGLIKSKYLWKESFNISEQGNEELLSVSQYDGITPAKGDTRSEALDGYKIVKKDDLVINIMLAWMGGLGISAYNGIVSPAYCVYKLNHNYNPRFFHYLYKTPLYLSEFAKHSTGVIPSRWRMYTDDFGQVQSLIPPIEEQNAIVAYLDKVTSKIGAAIAQQQKMIELLNERKQIIINNAVTKGLDPTAKMKPSGIPWLGNIPAHWEVRKLKYLATQVTTPSSNNNKIGLENIESGTGEFIQTETIFEGNGTEYKIGDILYGKLRPYLKKVFLAKDCGNAVGDFFIFRPNSDTNPEYLQHIFLSQQLTDVINSSTYGAKMPRVSIDFMGSLYLPFPPFDEQEHISSIIAKSSIPLNMQIDVCKKKIAFFQERKQIIINEVVTGKVKVI